MKRDEKLGHPAVKCEENGAGGLVAIHSSNGVGPRVDLGAGALARVLQVLGVAALLPLAVLRQVARARLSEDRQATMGGREVVDVPVADEERPERDVRQLVAVDLADVPVRSSGPGRLRCGSAPIGADVPAVLGTCMKNRLHPHPAGRRLGHQVRGHPHQAGIPRW